MVKQALQGSILHGLNGFTLYIFVSRKTDVGSAYEGTMLGYTLYLAFRKLLEYIITSATYYIHVRGV
jgi:hypothetical protein